MLQKCGQALIIYRFMFLCPRSSIGQSVGLRSRYAAILELFAGNRLMRNAVIEQKTKVSLRAQ
jgi:hypothetical protein